MSWEKPIKNLSTTVNNVKERLLAFLLSEDESFLLLETGGKIIINDDSYSFSIKNEGNSYSNTAKNLTTVTTKNKASSNWTNNIKNGS